MSYHGRINKEMTFRVYVLICPMKKEIVYVGLTTQNLDTRVSGHLAQWEATEEKKRWINELRQKNLRPVAKLVKEITCFKEVALLEERAAVEKYIKKGCKLLNGRLCPKEKTSTNILKKALEDAVE